MKKIKYLLFTLGLLMVCNVTVKAAGLCTVDALYDEQMAVTQMNITYEEIEETVDVEGEEFQEYYLAIIIHNVPDNVKMVFNVSTKDNTANTTLDSSAREEDGSIHFIDKNPSEPKSYDVVVTSTSRECQGTNLKTLKLNAPMLNPFLGSTGCENYPGFRWCDIFVNYNLNELTVDEFNKALDEYKEEKEEEEQKAKEEKDKENKKKTTRKYVLGVIVLVILGGLVTFIVIKKKKGSKLL